MAPSVARNGVRRGATIHNLRASSLSGAWLPLDPPLYGVADVLNTDISELRDITVQLLTDAVAMLLDDLVDRTGWQSLATIARTQSREFPTHRSGNVILPFCSRTHKIGPGRTAFAFFLQFP